MTCHVMQHHEMSCNAMQCHAMPYHATLSNATPHKAIQCHTTLGNVMPDPATPWHAMQCHAMQCNATQRHTTPCNSIQCHATLPHHEIQSNAMQNMSNCTRNWLMIVATMYRHTKGINCLEICHIAPKIGT